MNRSVDPEKLYKCDITVAFPSVSQAIQTKQVMEVDDELGDRVTKSFELVMDQNDEATNVLRISFAATQAKMLRVSVTSFYESMTVVLKCFQEFDTSSNVVSGE